MAEDKKYQDVLIIEEDEHTEASVDEKGQQSRQYEGLDAPLSDSVFVSFEGTSEEYRHDRSRSRDEEEEIEFQQVDGAEHDDSDSEGSEPWFNPKLSKTKCEEKLLETVKEKKCPKVRGRLTAKALMDSDNPLIFALKVTERLHERASKKGPDEEDFIDLANRVEQFTLRFLDPLKHDKNEREDFFQNSETDRILETAIKLDQKKVFDHPIIIGLLTERWYGGRSHSMSSQLWWLILNIWCLFDIVLFPAIFLAAYVLDWIAARVGDKMTICKGAYDKYKEFFKIPYFIFVRDTLSYLALLAMHLAICVQPSQVSFSGLEWVILFFFLGRLLNEVKQIIDMRRTRSANQEKLTLGDYIRDRWNIFDMATLIIFFIAILPLRIVTWAVSESVTNNRLLVFAAYFYGLNTMLLTLRAFGSVLETFKGVGTIQIALFHIMRDAVVVIVHFAAITLAFASAIAKIFVAETSMVKGEITEKKP